MVLSVLERRHMSEQPKPSFEGIAKRMVRAAVEASKEGSNAEMEDFVRRVNTEESLVGIKVPQALLVSEHPVGVKQVRLRKTIDVEYDGDDMVVSNTQGLMQKSVEMDIEILITSKDPPEGMELVLEHLERKLERDLKEATQ